MKEKRHNWKENISKAAKLKAEKRHKLLVDLDNIRRSISSLGNDPAKFDKLKAEQREIIAQLATL